MSSEHWESIILSDNESAEKPANWTHTHTENQTYKRFTAFFGFNLHLELTTMEWTAPMRTQANMATTSSTTMGM